jgi:hypothetical protein
MWRSFISNSDRASLRAAPCNCWRMTMADKLDLQPIELACKKYEAGYSIEAAGILMAYAKELAARGGQAKEEVTRAMSDRIAEVGVQLLYAGDCPARQEFGRRYDAWKRDRAELEQKSQRLAEIARMYLNLFTRLVEIVEEDVYSWEWLRRMPQENILEALAYGHDHGLSDQRAREYFLDRVHEDINELFAYAHSFNSKFCNSWFRRKIRAGSKHEHLAILLALESSGDQFKELKSLQAQLFDAPEYLLREPSRPVMLGAESELLVDLRKLEEESRAVLCH